MERVAALMEARRRGRTAAADVDPASAVANLVSADCDLLSLISAFLVGRQEAQKGKD
jgi:hypothetical protein